MKTHQEPHVNRDRQIQNEVLDELRWISDGGDSNLGVGVQDGIVTLTGFVPTYHERLLAESAAKRARGVRGVANEVRVLHAPTERRRDADLVRDCLEALDSRLPGTSLNIQVLVSDAHITLEGSVGTWRERRRAENTVRAIEGVVAVHNLVAVLPEVMLQEDPQFRASSVAIRGPDRVQ